MSDDEITRDVDPSWLARLRADAVPRHDNDDEHTIGNADLLDQVRAAVRDARAEEPPSSLSASPPTSSPQARPVEMSFPPPDPASPVHGANAAPTLTFPEARWQPPPRLKPVGPAAAPAPLADSTSRTRAGHPRRVLVVVVTAAVVAALVVGVLIGRSGSSGPAPGQDTVVTSGNTTITGNTTTGTIEVGP